MCLGSLRSSVANAPSDKGGGVQPETVYADTRKKIKTTTKLRSRPTKATNLDPFSSIIRGKSATLDIPILTCYTVLHTGGQFLSRILSYRTTYIQTRPTRLLIHDVVHGWWCGVLDGEEPVGTAVEDRFGR